MAGFSRNQSGFAGIMMKYASMEKIRKGAHEKTKLFFKLSILRVVIPCARASPYSETGAHCSKVL